MVEVERRGGQDAEPNQDAPLDVFHRCEQRSLPKTTRLPSVPDCSTKVLLHIPGHRTLSPPRLLDDGVVAGVGGRESPK